jgi:N-acetylglucosaminyldiphosphoundecaprenol N-acetyl-beta-D-mannosaminyltransferase
MKYSFFDLFVNIKDTSDYLEKIQNTIVGGEKKTFYYLNSYSFYLCFKDEAFKNAFLNSDYVIADGYSIVWGVKFLYKQKIEKVVFTHAFFDELGKILSEKQFSLYLFGGSDLIINKAVKNIKQNFPNINITGFSNGYLNNTADEAKIINEINTLKPDILVVGMGMPHSEIWIDNNQHKINAHCIFSVGAFLDFMAGEKHLAPKWLYNSGFEWVYRLIQEPVRLSKRYFVIQPFFLMKVFKEYLRK